jgi:D-3-phosphoglycerate dehydrogenase
VLCAEPQNYTEPVLRELDSMVTLTTEPLSGARLLERAPGIDALMVRLLVPVRAEFLDRATALKAILTPTTSLDLIDVEVARNREVRIFSLHGETEFLREIHSTAEHAFGLLVALVRKVPAATQAVREGRWELRPFRGHELYGKTLGIVGCGRLGSLVARYGAAFGMRVLAYDPHVARLPDGAVRCATLEELLRASDAVSVHVHLTDATRGMIGRRELGWLRPGAWLVNTARAPIVDEAALLDALEAGRLAGAAVDVLEAEHPTQIAGHPLVAYARTHDNLVITPNIGGATWEAVEKADRFVVEQFLSWAQPRHA